jgi:hypothetical protein
MSKIEKALRKARQDGDQSGQALVKSHRQKEPEHQPVSAKSVNLPVESNASAEIALMHQPGSLDSHQRLAKRLSS